MSVITFNTGPFSISNPVDVPKFPLIKELHLPLSHLYRRDLYSFVRATAPISPDYKWDADSLSVRISYVEEEGSQLVQGWHTDYSRFAARIHVLTTLAGATTLFAIDPHTRLERDVASEYPDYEGDYIAAPENCWVTFDTLRLHRTRPAEKAGWRMFIRLLEEPS